MHALVPMERLGLLRQRLTYYGVVYGMDACGVIPNLNIARLQDKLKLVNLIAHGFRGLRVKLTTDFDLCSDTPESRFVAHELHALPNIESIKHEPV